jgi:hypothetical protein
LTKSFLDFYICWQEREIISQLRNVGSFSLQNGHLKIDQSDYFTYKHISVFDQSVPLTFVNVLIQWNNQLEKLTESKEKTIFIHTKEK